MRCPGIFRPKAFRDNDSFSLRSGYEEGTVFRRIDSSPIAEVAKRHGVSEPFIYSERKKFGDLGTDDVTHLKQLGQENGHLKKILAERDLEIEVMKKVAVKKW